MNKLVLCSIAALAMSSSAAFAKTQTATVTLDGYCDTFTITTIDKTTVGLSSTNSACDPGIGSGYVGKVKKLGNYAVLGAILNGDVNDHWVVGLQYPLVTGGTYTFGYTSDGINVNNQLLTGTYTVNGTPSHGENGSKSITSTIHK